MSILGGSDGFVESKYDFLLLAYTNNENGFIDIAKIPGLSERLYLVSDKDQRPCHQTKWKYLVVYGFSGDPEKMKEALAAFDSEDDTALWFYEAIGPMTHKTWRLDDKEEHIFMALTNVKPGRETDFTEWYNRHHIPDVVSISVYRSGRRFRIVSACGADCPWQYLAFYRFVGPALSMHDILEKEVEQSDFQHSDAYVEDDAAWVYSSL